MLYKHGTCVNRSPPSIFLLSDCPLCFPPDLLFGIGGLFGAEANEAGELGRGRGRGECQSLHSKLGRFNLMPEKHFDPLKVLCKLTLFALAIFYAWYRVLKCCIHWKMLELQGRWQNFPSVMVTAIFTILL